MIATTIQSTQNKKLPVSFGISFSNENGRIKSMMKRKTNQKHQAQNNLSMAFPPPALKQLDLKPNITEEFCYIKVVFIPILIKLSSLKCLCLLFLYVR